MHVRVVAGALSRIDLVRQHVGRRGISDVVAVIEPTDRYELRIGATLGRRDLAHLHQALRPMRPAVVTATDLPSGVDAVLSLGDARPLTDWRIVVSADTVRLATRLRRAVEAAGFASPAVGSDDPERDVIRYGGLPPLARDLLLLTLAAEGVRAIGEKNLDDDSRDVRILVRDPRRTRRSAGAAVRSDRRERCRVLVATDDPEKAAPLRERLEAAGFTDVEFRRFCDLWDPVFAYMGYRIFPGALRRRPAALEALRTAVTEAMAALGATPAFSLHVDGEDRTGRRRGRFRFPGLELPSFPDPTRSTAYHVQIVFPTEGVADGRLKERIAHPGRFRLAVMTPSPDDWEDLMQVFGTFGFLECGVRPPQPGATPHIEYGGAPPELIERVRAAVKEQTGLDLPARKAWHDGDPDIWVHLGRRAKCDAGLARRSRCEPGEIEEWLSVGSSLAARPPVPFLRVEGDRLFVGEIALHRRPPSNDPRIPALGEFAHFAICPSAAAILHHVAQSVALREPCLLEGVTGSLKTSCVLLLAAWLRQPIYRLNLDGACEPGDLVGRFVPDDGAGGDARRARRKAMWRWLDGLLVRAMRDDGAWLLIDELNLAEPQILERMNSVLEDPPSLVVSEHANEAIGRGGDPVHPAFRLFATMNPAEYQGRSQLSPAYLSRWRAHLIVDPPAEQDYRAILELLVFGRQPPLTFLGCEYAGPTVAAAYPDLAKLAGIEKLLSALARFQVMLESATGQDGGTARIGARRRERPVFTLRDLLSVVRCIAGTTSAEGGEAATRAIRAALARYYLSRLAGPEDRKAVMRLLDAAGIGPGAWSLP